MPSALAVTIALPQAACSAAKSGFISHMSHELRTPLHAIITSSQYLITYGKLDDEQLTVVANVENAAGGFGITAGVLSELERLPIDVFTTGNHVWDKKEGVPLLDAPASLLVPGVGCVNGCSFCSTSHSRRRPTGLTSPPVCDATPRPSTFRSSC